MIEDDELKEINPLALSKPQRQKLLSIWKNELYEQHQEELRRLVQKIATHTHTLNDKFCQHDAKVLQSAKIIGMTTSGCAKNRQLIDSVKPSIVVCEEAGEVLESHVITSISEGITQQLILIGDHQQLRPKVEEYMFSIDSRNGYNFDISLFERLVEKYQKSFTSEEIVKDGLLVTLQTQRRMLPLISNLIRTTLYPKLLDYPDVCKYPPVKGFMSPLWFYDHNNPESEHSNTKSYMNTAEVEITVQLIKYLVRQGYQVNDIAVLTPYLGQLLALRDALSKERMVVFLSEMDEEEIVKKNVVVDDLVDPTAKKAPTAAKVALKNTIRLSTVDNFQGEEATIVILSTVRCNKKNSIGFLKNSNRVNVMISRAKHGMIILGSAATVKSTKCLFSSVVKQLKELSLCQDYFALQCVNHGEVNVISTLKELKEYAMDGGCKKKCDSRLICGHKCDRSCHPDDINHYGFQCMSKCIKKHACGHPCKKLCFETCGICPKLVEKELPCGHKGMYKCGEPTTGVKCMQKVQITHSLCDHPLTLQCHQVADAEKYFQKPSIKNLTKKKFKNLQCKQICGCVLPCEHKCQKKCYDCTIQKFKSDGKPNHGICTVRLEHLLPCGHFCSGVCGHSKTECPPCKLKCTNRCVHSSCPQHCAKPCPLCAEPCSWKCNSKHKNPKRCSLLCGDICARLPCNEPCTKKLSCGHPCPSICGEKCPHVKYCPVCTKGDIKTRNICVIDTDLTLENIDLEETRIIDLPTCDHVLTVDTLDGLFRMNDFYVMNQRTGDWTGVKEIQIKLDELNPICPYCKNPIRQIFRYSRPLNFIFLEQSKRKFLLQAQFYVRTLDKGNGRPVNIEIVKKANGFYYELLALDPLKAIYERDPMSTRERFEQPYASVLVAILGVHIAYYKTVPDKFRVKEEETFALSLEFAIELFSICHFYGMAASLGTARAMLRFLAEYASADAVKKVNAAINEIDPEFAKSFAHQISLEEQKMVFEVMIKEVGSGVGSFGGHWYECPNGHIYTIGECGGAMQESCCPECGEQIGGSGHRLQGRNRTASNFLKTIGRADLVQ